MKMLLEQFVEGKNGHTTFLPLNTKVGGPVNYIKDKEVISLMDNQARHKELNFSRTEQFFLLITSFCQSS